MPQHDTDEKWKEMKKTKQKQKKTIHITNSMKNWNMLVTVYWRDWNNLEKLSKKSETITTPKINQN